jgi:hypothetical protein
MKNVKSNHPLNLLTFHVVRRDAMFKVNRSQCSGIKTRGMGVKLHTLQHGDGM